jgi:branched-chain amino acid transport system substrate-binding protein
MPRLDDPWVRVTAGFSQAWILVFTHLNAILGLGYKQEWPAHTAGPPRLKEGPLPSIRHCAAVLAGLLVAAPLAIGCADAQPAATTPPTVKIGVLTDMGSSYSDYGGAGSVLAARMAIADSGMADRVQLVSSDTQNKADVGAGIAHAWFSADVDAIFDVPNSSVALSVNGEAGRSRKLVFFSTTINDRITEQECNGYGIAWVWDTYSVGRSEALSLLKAGKDTWFVITPDGAAGAALEQTARQAAQDNGGRVLGSLHHAIGETDWASFLLQARASGAKAVLFGSGGADLVNGLKQAREFGLPQSGMTLATMYMVITDVDALGLEAVGGLNAVTAFYWDRDDASRGFARRFFEQRRKMPTMFQAGVYSAVTQYLKAVQATGSKAADTVRDHLRKTPMEDMFLRHGKLLANGRMLNDILLVRIKTPAESKRPWDYFQITGVVPGEDAFRKLSASACPLVK